MARDTRSPSPVGSTYSSSKRSRRSDDNYDKGRRHEVKGYRRSRSPETPGTLATIRHIALPEEAVRAPDIVLARRMAAVITAIEAEAVIGRIGEGEMTPVIRVGGEGTAPLTPGVLLGGTAAEIETDQAYTSQVPKQTPNVTPAQTDEQKKAGRLAKLEAWKQKQAAERERKQNELTAGGARGLLDEIDKKVALSRGVSTPPASTPTPPVANSDSNGIAKGATSSTAKPLQLKKAAVASGSTKVSEASTLLPANTVANKPSAGASSSSSAVPLKTSGNLNGFGLGTKVLGDSNKLSVKRTLNFGDEESKGKKLLKLPDSSLEAFPTNGATQEGDDEDDDTLMQDGGTEEENAAAARAAAEKREQSRLQPETISEGNQDDEAQSVEPAKDIVMTDNAPGNADLEAEEEIDPLDAFMSDLKQNTSAPKQRGTKSSNPKHQQPEAMFGDENDININTIEPEADDFLAMASKSKRKKDMPSINHSKVNYEPFRKNFYTEPVDLAGLTEAEVANLRLELDGIKVRGVDVPTPVQKWSQCGLGVQTLDVIRKLGYEGPTSIQSQAVPAIMSGRDVIGVAKTGSGKTIAFLLPMFRHIRDQRPLDNMEGPISLIMTPTRELATQIHKECRPFLKALNLRAVCAYGGAPIKDQIAELKRGAEIIVCTPGRMIDLLTANSGRVTNLRRVTYVVLDEADRMFDMGFEPQVMKILGNIRPNRQTVLFSATFPRNMEALARKTLSKPVEIIVGGRSVVAPEITQIVEVRNDDAKFVRLLELLGNLYSDDENEDARTLVFVDRQEAADRLLRDLMRKGYPCMSIHGGKDQIDRDSTIDDFKAGIFPILIATSVAARGLDVKQLKLVVNYDAPNHLEDYVHRAGRTGRAGNTGTAVTFLTEDQERYSVDISKALKQSGQPVPEAVQKMVTAFLDKVKEGKEKASGSGFGGKGLERLDQERDATRNRERKTYKTGEEGEEEDKEEEKKEKETDLFSRVASAVQSSTAATPTISTPGGVDLDGKITVHRTQKEPSSTTGKNPLDKVGSAVADIHARLNKAGVMRSGVPIDNKGPDAGAFHATLEINDFPQKARWAVTNRTNVAKILEATGTSITTKGSFYPAGKEPQPGENAKLYILVEGDTELVVTNAMRELMRLLKEGTIAAADSDARAPTGRYNVV
ncbi:pre-mRNA-processing ATP-dependent RNA helicase prp5 [Arthroderma uncinatum]|uniref:pre-mRNA-processing ATP-dependent RNA helicase prp5 n=1 Tax=Arthroderma uncinatum TaxID=74035 RepID=UPI00144A9AED|nr:pre-mRNA-processing ATP-dependent RNA helicase prp5 [Arthroderma uncinatum]KAF3481492.1 pre-mRNA-processing ATP-dependent RNA helicase prp5 [Arthroderma uncinatum]